MVTINNSKSKDMQMNEIKVKILVLNVSEFITDQAKLNREIDKLQIDKKNIIVHPTANNNLMLYLKNESDLKAILHDQLAFDDKKKIRLDLTEKIDVVIKGLSYEQALSLMDQLKIAGITEIINLEKKKIDSVYENENSSPKTKHWLIVGAKCCDVTTINRLSNEGIKIEYMRYKVEKYIRPIHVIQCHQCNQFGHKLEQCTNKQSCLRCSGDHTIKECSSTTRKCSNCGGNHHATYKQCRTYQQKVNEKMEKLKNKSPSKRIESANPLPISPKKLKDQENANSLILDEIRNMRESNKAHENKIDKIFEAMMQKMVTNENEIKEVKQRVENIETESNECWKAFNKHDNTIDEIEKKLTSMEEVMSKKFNSLYESYGGIQREILKNVIDCHNFVNTNNILDVSKIEKLFKQDKQDKRAATVLVSSNKSQAKPGSNKINRNTSASNISNNSNND